MKYLDYFKDKFRSKGQRSAPELREERKSEGYSGPDRITKLYEAKAQNLRAFSFSELRRASRGKLGKGDFGSVYKGKIKPADGKGEPLVVAIKKLNHDSVQRHKEWMAEVQFLSVVEHPNIIKLIGHCAVDGEREIQRLLVYEFMRNKSLDDHLFSCAFPPLPWKTRLRIVLGAAQGLAYLHEGLQVQVIHRDFKPSNVLLDENFSPKLFNFGLAIEGPMAGNTHVSTDVMGTYGYTASEYVMTGHVYVKSDVWSFGVVLYEILTGRQSIDTRRRLAERILLKWVKEFPAKSKNFSSIMDPRLKNEYSIREAQEIAKLADTIVLNSPNDE